MFLGIASQEGFTSLFVPVLLAAIGLVLTPIYLLSMAKGVLRPRIPALASVEHATQELVIGMSLLVPTLVIGIWPRIAMDLYEASTDNRQ